MSSPNGGLHGRVTARVITVSTRAAAGVYPDDAGPVVAQSLAALGMQVDGIEIVSDGPEVAMALRAAVADGVQCVVTTGGTGISPSDRTPEATAEIAEILLPGFGEVIRAVSRGKVQTADLSRATAGIAGNTLIVNVPGSVGGASDAMNAIRNLLPHALDQLRGADHERIAVGEPIEVAPVGEPEPLGEHCLAAVVLRAVVTAEPIDTAEHELSVSGPDRGAVVGFSGVVRNHDHGRTVRKLEYVAHPMAVDVLKTVSGRAARMPGVSAVAVSHRVGVLDVGDVALSCAVSAAHRDVAFKVCAWLVDEVKLQVPIWKRQEFENGTDEWVRCP